VRISDLKETKKQNALVTQHCQLDEINEGKVGGKYKTDWEARNA
jgi:hypothetical protein